MKIYLYLTSDGPDVEAVVKDEDGSLRESLVASFKRDVYGEGTTSLLELDTDDLDIVVLASATDGEIN